MGFDLIALAVFGAFVLLGMLRGLVPSGLGLASLVLGYVNGAYVAKQFGPVVAERLDMTAFIVAPILGTLGFLATLLAFGILTIPIRRADRQRASSVGRDVWDRLGGGLMGGVRGTLVVVLLALLVSWLDAAREITQDPRLASVPEAKTSRVADASSRAIEGAIGAALGGNTGRAAGRILAHPGESLSALQSVTSDPAIRALQSDAVFWSQVENSQAHNAVFRPSFQQLIQNAPLRRQLADAGMIDREAAASPDAFRAELVAVLEDLGPRLRALKADPAMRELASDPEVLARLEAGDPWALLADGRIHRLASRIAEGP